jgi:hypothetical protein
MTTPRIPSGFVAPPGPEQQPAEAAQNEHPDDAPKRDAEAVDAAPAAAQDGPEPMAAGTFAIYDDTRGGYVFVISTREGQTIHKHFPATVVKAAEMFMGGRSPLAELLGAA